MTASRFFITRFFASLLWLLIFIADTPLLLAGTSTVGDYTLTVTGGDPSTNPVEAVAARGKKSQMFFVITFEEESSTRVEEEAVEIEKVIYTVTFITSNSSGITSTMTSAIPSVFKQRMSGDTAIHTKETTDGKILSAITAIVRNTPVGKTTATLSVTVYPKEGDPVSASHSISVEGLECSAFAYAAAGSIEKNKKNDKYVWDTTLFPTRRRKSVIGHATWKVQIPDPLLRSLPSDDKATNWYKKGYYNKKVGFSSSEDADDQPVIQKAQNDIRQTGNFNAYSVPGELSFDGSCAEKGKHGITLNQAKAGLQFIERHFGTKKDKYGANNNCVDMAVQGLNAAGVNRGVVKKSVIQVIYRDLRGKKRDDGRIELSLPKDFAELYATP